jgi:ketosteroid isomerase-like protein
MRTLLLLVLFLLYSALLVFAADPATDLKKADRDWEKTAEARDINQFVNFVADDVWECGPDGKWVHGRDATRNEFAPAFADPNFKLSWTLESAEVDRSGNFGYTRGTFQGVMGGKPMSGSYATFWKKGKDSMWRAAVDIASVATPQ